MKVDPRLRHYCYRCYRCGRLLTRLELIRRWEIAEQDPNALHMTICDCGSRHLTPTNPKWWEELLYPRVWKLWYYEIFLPWLKSKF